MAWPEIPENEKHNSYKNQASVEAEWNKIQKHKAKKKKNSKTVTGFHNTSSSFLILQRESEQAGRLLNLFYSGVLLQSWKSNAILL